MAYIANDLAPALVAGPDFTLWNYDTTDAAATVAAAAYISDALARKMKVGDVIFVRQFTSLATKTTITAVTQHKVTAVASSGATLGAGTAVA